MAYLDLLLGFQLGRDRPLLDDKLARGWNNADEPFQCRVPLISKKEHQLALGALELHLQAHL